MLRTILFTLLGFISLTAFAYRDAYYVSGYDENSVPIHGIVYTNHDHWEVRGRLIDANDNTFDYEGRWNGPGWVTGQTDRGEFIDLKTYPPGYSTDPFYYRSGPWVGVIYHDSRH